MTRCHITLSLYVNILVRLRTSFCSPVFSASLNDNSDIVKDSENKSDPVSNSATRLFHGLFKEYFQRGDYLRNLKFAQMCRPRASALSPPPMTIPQLISSPWISGCCFILIVSRHKLLMQLSTLSSFSKPWSQIRHKVTTQCCDRKATNCFIPCSCSYRS